MTSITTWIRIEPHGRDPDLTPGIEARVHDPLWLLARQWQLGELDGEDGGSAILARVRHDAGTVDHFSAGGPFIARDPRLPLEALAEAGRRDDPRPLPDLAGRARTGRQLERLLARDGLTATAARARDVFAIAVDDATAARLDDADRAWLAAVRGRAPDGVVAAAVVRVHLPSPPPGLAAPTDDPAAVASTCAAWLAWYDGLAVDALAGTTWRDDRLEAGFAARGTLAGRVVELRATEHHGAPLGWTSVELAEGEPAGAAPPTVAATVVPGPVRYRGMPARRYWELEDAAVDWSAVDARPGDVARMLSIDFALVFADDWLQIPIEVDTGSLVRIASLVVTDTFGVRTRISPASGGPGQPPWRVFGHAGGDGEAPILLVHPALPIVAGPVEDEVVVAADEHANLAWAIERRAAATDGLTRVIRSVRPPPRHGYTVGAAVADGWHPLRPTSRDGATVLARAAVPGPARAPHTALVERLSVLAPEELAAGPIRLRTQHRLARRPDGTLVVWRAVIRDAVAHGTAPASGLAFDRIAEETP